MRLLKMILAFAVLGVATLAVVIPVMWLRAVDSLPVQIEKAYDVELQLRQKIESDRNSIEQHKAANRRKPVAWARPNFDELPKELVAIYINEMGCPSYFEKPKEEGFKWNRRVLFSAFDHPVGGGGRCELYISLRLAGMLGAESSMQYAVAADRIHQYLTKDELVAFDLHAMQFKRGVFGVRDASRELLQKELTDLTLSELAELALAMPPYDAWNDLEECTTVTAIRANRDKVLQSLREAGLITAEQEKTAAAQMPRCMDVKR